MIRTFGGLRRKHARVLIVTAHPDDESIFAGGTIAEFKKWRWTVLCVTDCDRRYNLKRRKELLRACRVYNESGSHITPFMMCALKRKGRFSRAEIREGIRRFIDSSGPFDAIFTHSRSGDYGHRTHRLVRFAAEESARGGLYGFCMPGRRRPPSARTVRLSEESRLTKARALDVYLRGSQKRNLSGLKSLVRAAISSRSESFDYVD